ncbi:MAG TPA: hypothetical protein VM695_12695 [Phycisphaerae bacterium]|nr:hypothetical protein [Phycisphaerae bacterium]
MLALTIGWQEVLLVLLFVLGLVVIPLPGRWMRRAKRRPLRWSQQFRSPPIPAIHDVAEAFFCSYERGEYTLASRERFRLTFRRGRAPAEDDGQIVLSLRRDEERPEDLPVTLRVLLQPRAGCLLITLNHEARPKKAPSLVERRRMASRFQRELRDFRAYLRDNFPAPDPQAGLPMPRKRIEGKWTVKGSQEE